MHRPTSNPQLIRAWCEPHAACPGLACPLHSRTSVLERPSAYRLGKAGETLASEELRRRGYAITATNYRTRFAEIDIVCEKGDLVVFVEVKVRRSARRGSAAESIPIWKRRRLGSIALEYLAATRRFHRRCRFDVVAIDGIGTPDQHLRVIEDAFRPGDWS